MNWKWKGKWLLSLAVSFSMVVSAVGTAAATEPATPTVTTDTGEITDSDSGENTDTDSSEATDPGSGENTDSDSGEATDPGSGENTDTDSDQITDPGSGGNTDTDSGEATDPGSGGNTDTDSGEATDPGSGGNTDTDSGEATDPGSCGNTDTDSDQTTDPDSGENTDTDSDQTTDPGSGGNTDTDSDQTTDPGSGENTDTDSDQTTDPGSGENTDMDSDQTTDPSPDGDSDTDSDQTTVPDSDKNTDTDSGEGKDPNPGEETEADSDDETGDAPNDESSVDPENPDEKTSIDLIPDIHEHKWSLEWSYDETCHWHPCDDQDCPVTDNSEKDGYAEHGFGEDNVCIQCGYTQPVKQLARAAIGAVPTYDEAYDAMIALKKKYPEGTTWTNFTPYGSDGPLGDSYVWKGGRIYGSNQGVGCSAFAFILSDEAFDNLPARPITKGSFTFDDVKVGDILRVRNNSHSVIVLQKSAGGVIVAEGNYNKSVHWGRAMSKSEVMTADFIITRYPEGYESEDNPDDEELAQDGTAGSLNWSLTNGGVLTISGDGAIPDYSLSTPAPWKEYSVNTVILEDGVTGIGDYAFYGSGVLSIYIPDGVERIGNNAFERAALLSVSIPGSVSDIGAYAFHECPNLTSVTVSEGIETIGEEAFRGCTSLAYIDFPASITSVGIGAFMSCEKMTRVRFMPGTGTVTLGDNLFSQCWNLDSVTLPQTIDRISVGMFQSCTKLSTLYIPASVKEIGIDAFNSTSLARISFGGSETEWNNMITPYLEPSLKYTEIIYNVPFDDPFATDPNDPGDFKPGEDGGGTDPSDPGNGDGSHKHNWSQSWTYNDTSHWHQCDADCTITDNRNKDGYGRHRYGGWTIDVYATSSQSGSRHRDCTVCLYRQTERIPATGSSGGSDSDSGSSGGSSGGSSSGSGNNSGSSSDSSGSSGNSSDTVGSSHAPDTTVERSSDGSSITTTTQQDGTVTRVTTDAAGKAETEVQLSALAVSTAQQRGEAVSLPVPAVSVVRDVATAPAITVHTGSESVKVAIPTVLPTTGTVAMIIREDGSAEVIPSSVSTNNSVVVSVPNGATVKIVDNSKQFPDVPAGSPFTDGIGFVSARDLFYSPTAASFAPQGAMTSAMLMTALARFDGANTAGGATWYAQSMEWAATRGLSNGADPDSNIFCGELITTVWKYMGSPMAANSPSGYTDAGLVSDQEAAMNWAVKNGIANGFQNGIPDSQGQITRGQAAQMIMNLVNHP